MTSDQAVPQWSMATSCPINIDSQQGCIETYAKQMDPVCTELGVRNRLHSYQNQPRPLESWGTKQATLFHSILSSIFCKQCCTTLLAQFYYRWSYKPNVQLFAFSFYKTMSMPINKNAWCQGFWTYIAYLQLLRPHLVHRKSIGKVEESSSYSFVHCSRIWNKGMNGKPFIWNSRQTSTFGRKKTSTLSYGNVFCSACVRAHWLIKPMVFYCDGCCYSVRKRKRERRAAVQ